jgi:SWI/SNF-related matrix-associated actin-dependent regulator 1 of chromatin subfamily A
LADSQTLQLRDFQQEDVDFIAQNNFRVLVANAPGTGKTVICLSCIRIAPGRLLPTLIVCPASVVRNWRKEARKWTPGLRIHLIEDTNAPLPEAGADLYIISWALLAERWEELAKVGIQLIIGDEIHFAKNEEALRTQAMASLCARAPHLLLLSGTPIINEESELESIYSLYGANRPPMIRRFLEDVAPDIPAKQRARLEVELPERIAHRYRSANEDFEAWLEREMAQRMDDGEAADAAARALAAAALVKIGYLRRILAVGKVYAAADWAARAVRTGEQVVMFAEHQDVIKRLQRCLRKQGIRFVTIDGSTSNKDRQSAVDQFQRRLVPVFIGSKAAKEGLTLTAARHLCFIERYWTAAEEEQGEDRIRRIGQRHHTKIWFLHVPGTVDDRISTIIERKRRLVRRIIGAIDIAETPERNVAEIIAAWGQHAQVPEMEVHNLGTAKPLPPLPRTKELHAIRFNGTRWTPKGAVRWCRMMGYKPRELETVRDGFQIVMTSANLFRDGTFKRVKVAKDIDGIIGNRLTEKR